MAGDDRSEAVVQAGDAPRADITCMQCMLRSSFGVMQDVQKLVTRASGDLALLD